MAGTTYGITFSKKLCDQGRYDEAVREAEKAIAQDEADPQAVYDRGAALYCLGRFEESVGDFAKAIELEAQAGVMEEGVLDDDLFECLRKWAESQPAQCRAILGRYAQLMPSGNHLPDVGKWIRHIESDPKNQRA